MVQLSSLVCVNEKCEFVDTTVQQIWGCILLWKQKYVYLVEFAMQNIKLAFKLWDWLWFKNIFDYIAVWIQDTTVNLHELNEAPFRSSLVLNFRSIPLHRLAVIG